MATIKFDGLVDYLRDLNKLYADTTIIIKQAVYDGAGVAADAVTDAIKSLPEDSEDFYAVGDAKLQGVTPLQKQGLLEGFGISKMKTEGGYTNVKLGFDGYNKKTTKKYPQGQPNLLIARSLVSGASFRRGKIPFVSKAVKAAKARCEEAMEKKVDEQIKKIMK